MQGLFITGTDTDVGKTYVAAAIARVCRATGLRVGAYKPVCSGGETTPEGDVRWHDADALRAALDHQFPLDRVCPQRFLAPLAPPSAAAAEGREVDTRLLRAGVEAWNGTVDLLIVEGVGGLLCPLTDEGTVADFAATLRIPLVIVAGLRLGCVNQTLLTVDAAQHRQLPIAGLILNQAAPDDGSTASSLHEIRRRSPAPILAILPFVPHEALRPPELIRRIDWMQHAASFGN